MRLYLENKKYNDRLAEKKLIEFQRMHNETKNTPSILNNSRKLANSANSKPLHERANKVIEKQKENLQKKTDFYKDKEEKFTFKPKLNVLNKFITF